MHLYDGLSGCVVFTVFICVAHTKDKNVEFIFILITYYVAIDGDVSFILPANVLMRPTDQSDTQQHSTENENCENLVFEIVIT